VPSRAYDAGSGAPVPPELLGRLMLVLKAQARDEACSVCGKPRHAVLVGLPPRLVPCDLVHEPAKV